MARIFLLLFLLVPLIAQDSAPPPEQQSGGDSSASGGGDSSGGDTAADSGKKEGGTESSPTSGADSSDKKEESPADSSDGGDALPEVAGAIRTYIDPDLPIQNFTDKVDVWVLLQKILNANADKLAHVTLCDKLAGEVDYVIQDATFNRLLTRLEDDGVVAVEERRDGELYICLPIGGPGIKGQAYIQFFIPDITLGAGILHAIDLRTFLQRWSLENRKNLAVDPRLHEPTPKIFVNNVDSTINKFLTVLVNNGLIQAQRLGDFVYVQPPGDYDFPWPNQILYNHDKATISFDLSGMSPAFLVEEIQKISGQTVLIDPEFIYQQSFSGQQGMLPFDLGIRTLVEANGHQLSEDETKQVFIIENSPDRQQGISFRDNRFTVWFENKPLDEVVRQLSTQTHVPLVVSEKLEGEVSVDVRDMPLEPLLSLLFEQTVYEYIYLEGNYLVRTRPTQRDVVKLEKIRATTVVDMLPESYTKDLTVTAVSQLNSIIITGDIKPLSRLKELLGDLDQRVPQVLMEVVMVTLSDDHNTSLGWSIFAGENQLFPNVDIQLTGAPDANGDLQVARLPADYKLQLQALEEDGKARVINKPLVAALSGEKASITVGQTLYYRIETEEIVGTDNPRVRTTQKIESVDANFSLEITPFVINNNVLTVKVAPNFDSFSGSVSDNVPPPKNVTSLESTVRLKNGETIVLGGMIIDSESLSSSGLPYISRIPILGNLFKTRNESDSLSESYLFITPRVYYEDPDPSGLEPSINMDQTLDNNFKERRKEKKKRRKRGR